MHSTSIPPLATMQTTLLNDDPLWFKDAVIYEVPVKSFADSNGDGIGDFRGLTEKLDYLQDLGVTAIWTLPFFPSPLRDDGYDIADYLSINPIYGSLEDFQELLNESHARGIRVIIELIVNHTSDQHPWFQRARHAPAGSPERDFYVWSDTPERFPDVRIIFQDFETSNWAWDPVAKAYYWHRFYSHQPDINYRNPAVQQAVLDVVDFWLAMGVDGLRMDAVPYLYEQDDTNCENLPETHDFLKKLRQHVDDNFSNILLLAEANQWPEDAATYYGKGDECHMNFHFPLMPRLFMGLRMEDSFPIADILKQTPSIPNNCQWALFLRNHDELTLEMVSDEDRDYMYRTYAQDPQARINLGIRRRLAPLLGNDRRQIELMNGLLMSLPGTPVLYYGDELGMGDNIYLGDRDGVRTPMQWSADRNAGFSRANPHRLYLPVVLDSEYHYEAINVEAQRANTSSLWWWMKRLLAVRARFQAFGRGTFELLYPENRKVLAFTRTYGGEHILVVANLSRFVQSVELDLTPFHGMVPVEIFGRNPFPAIAKAPYFLSIAPHAFYWFLLQPVDVVQGSPQAVHEPPSLEIQGAWQTLLTQPEFKPVLNTVLSSYLRTCPWFRGKGRTVQGVTVQDTIALNSARCEVELVILEVEYTEGLPELYSMPLTFGALATPDGAIAQLQLTPAPAKGRSKTAAKSADVTTGWLFDALLDEQFLPVLLEAIAKKRRYKGSHGQLVASTTNAFKTLDLGASPLDPHPYRGEQDNSSIVYGDQLILKLYRSLEDTINPDLEVSQLLTEQQSSLTAPVFGALEYRRPNQPAMSIGILRGYVPDTTSAWNFTLDRLRGYFEQVLVSQIPIADLTFPLVSIASAQELEIPEVVYDHIGSYLGAVELLGQRTAELHLALASEPREAAFAPEPFTSFYQRSVYQYSRNLAGQVMLTLKKRLNQFSEPDQTLVQTVLNRQDQILDRFQRVLNQKITAMRSRCHGDYHLGQVLYTGKDFVIIDFKGESNRPMSERRMKRSPLRDVAGMVQSFYYAVSIGLRQELDSGLIRPEQQGYMEQWADYWYRWVSVVFLKHYLAIAQPGQFLPTTEQECQIILDAYLLEKVLQELSDDLEQHPDWIEITLQRILQLLEG